MNKIITGLFILLAITFLSSTYHAENEKIGPLLASALNNPNENTFTVWVYLKDKRPSASRMLSNPLSTDLQTAIV